MNFKEKYSEIWSFFAAYFPDADFDELTDEQVVSMYIFDCMKSEVSKKDLEKVLNEMPQLIEDAGIYWNEISIEANRYFSSVDDAIEWLKMVQATLRNKTSKYAENTGC